jgi:transcriptional regulator with XRE-family HTH domain
VKINHEALRALRERSGYTISAFASEAGIDRSHLSNIEAGRRQASPSAITRMAEVLKVPVTALIHEPCVPVEVAS